MLFAFGTLFSTGRLAWAASLVPHLVSEANENQMFWLTCWVFSMVILTEPCELICSATCRRFNFGHYCRKKSRPLHMTKTKKNVCKWTGRAAPFQNRPFTWQSNTLLLRIRWIDIFMTSLLIITVTPRCSMSQRWFLGDKIDNGAFALMILSLFQISVKFFVAHNLQLLTEIAIKHLLTPH